MNEKQSKKLRQIYRKDVRSQFEVLKKILRPKPKYLPKWLWRWGMRIYFKTN
jgi:hypothetical protein